MKKRHVFLLIVGVIAGSRTMQWYGIDKDWGLASVATCAFLLLLAERVANIGVSETRRYLILGIPVAVANIALLARDVGGLGIASGIIWATVAFTCVLSLGLFQSRY